MGSWLVSSINLGLYSVNWRMQSNLSSGKPLGKVNATIIILAPKVQNPSYLGDLWPISFCNVKCDIQVHNLLKNLLYHNQTTAFIINRSIIENVVIVHACMLQLAGNLSSNVLLLLV